MEIRTENSSVSIQAIKTVTATIVCLGRCTDSFASDYEGDMAWNVSSGAANYFFHQTKDVPTTFEYCRIDSNGDDISNVKTITSSTEDIIEVVAKALKMEKFVIIQAEPDRNYG